MIGTLLSRQKLNTVAVAWIVLVVSAVFAPILSGRYSFYPFDLLHNLYSPFAAHPHSGPAVQVTSIIDYIAGYYPSRVFEWESLRHHELPLWNPLMWGGHPTLASNGSRPVLDPFNSLYLWLDLPLALAWRAYLQDVTCALLMFLYVRSLNVGRAPATVAALAFALNSMFYANVFDWSLGGVLWLPLLLWTIDRALESRSLARCILSGLLLGVALLSSPLQIGAFLVWAIAVITIARGLVEGGSFAACVSAARLVMIITIIGASVAAIQFIPTIELITLSQRRLTQSGQGIRTPLQMLTGTIALTTFLFPPLAGQMKDGLLFAQAWGGTTHFQGYIGVLPLLAGAIAVPLAGLRRTAPYLILAVSTLALILYTPLSMFLYDRFFVLYVFAAAVLAAIGIDELAKSISPSRGTALVLRLFTVAIAGIAVTTFVWTLAYSLYHDRILDWGAAYLERTVSGRYLGNDLALYVKKLASSLHALTWLGGPTAITLVIAVISLLLVKARIRGGNPQFFCCAAIVLVSVDLSYSAATHLPYVDMRVYPPFPAVEGLQRIKTDTDLFRVLTLRRYGQEPPLLDSSMLIPYGIQSVQGKDNLYPPNLWTILPPDMQSGSAVLPTDYRLLDVENVKYVIVGPSTMLPSTRFDLVHDGDMRVYQNRHVLPRAFLATNVTVISDFDRALQFLRSEQFQPALTAIVDKHVRTSESKANVFSDIRVTSYTNTHVSVHAATSTDGLLVLSDTFYPGWRATVDGKRTDVIRTNVAMRGIELPAGVHVVEFSYQPLSLAVGRVLSVGSICAALIVITVDFLRTWHWRTTAPGAVATIS